MSTQITVTHTKEEFEKTIHMNQPPEKSSELTPNHNEETTMAKVEPKEGKQDSVQKEPASNSPAPHFTEDKKFVGELLQHLTTTQMTAGQLDLLLQKLEVQFDQLIHGQLVGKLKHTDNYVFAKEYLDMEIQPMKDVIERMKRMLGSLQDKQITLADDLKEIRQEIGGDIDKVKKEMGAVVSEAQKDIKAGIERQGKTVNARVDHEIQQLNHNMESQLKNFRNEFSESLKKDQKTLENQIKDLGEQVTDKIRQERERLEAENQKLSQKTAEANQKVQDSLHTLSEYMTLVIDAAGVRSKIEKLSYDKSLDEMKSIKL